MKLRELMKENGDTLANVQGSTVLAPEALDDQVTFVGTAHGSVVYRIESDLSTDYFVQAKDGSAHLVTSDDLTETPEPGTVLFDVHAVVVSSDAVTEGSGL